MVHVFFRRVNSPQQSIIIPSMYNKMDIIEHKLGETYCYGLDNYDNEPPKYIVIIDENDNIIYSGRIIIPDNEDDNLYLVPHLTKSQKNAIIRSNYVIVKEPPDEFGAETDTEDEQDGGKNNKTKKNRRKNKNHKKSKKMGKSKRRIIHRKTKKNKKN